MPFAERAPEAWDDLLDFLIERAISRSQNPDVPKQNDEKD
ncbi:hypothetical protein LMG29739_03148 [Paraburkholderia solisilvae]|uniref:Uncharacterized protein n=1 Tax=Paraburkholderia solisilvae TaxID=624376 RepID=A0A6J5E0D5_9BURK|nr:hypothetical protein LMG29739_03148 [Paraburkholderia solisilvae]